MGRLGVNVQEVPRALSEMQAAYESMMNTMFSDTQINFIEPMKGIWTSRKAQEFFIALSDVWNAVCYNDEASINNKIAEIFNSINSAALASVENEKSEDLYTSKQFNEISGLSLKIDDYPEMAPDGFVGIIDPQDFVAKISNVRAAFDEVSTQLNKIKQTTSAALFGDEANEQLNETVTAITTNFKSRLDELCSTLNDKITGEEGASQDLSTKIVAAFSGQGA